MTMSIAAYTNRLTWQALFVIFVMAGLKFCPNLPISEMEVRIMSKKVQCRRCKFYQNRYTRQELIASMKYPPGRQPRGSIHACIENLKKTECFDPIDGKYYQESGRVECKDKNRDGHCPSYRFSITNFLFA
jgi:hypothetical protein